MTDLERRALLGDRQAQEECTEKWIALPCPICGRKEVLTLHSSKKIYHNYDVECPFNGMFIKLKDWNTRPAPPIGRCWECRYRGECDENGYSICESTGFGVTNWRLLFPLQNGMFPAMGGVPCVRR